MGSEIFKPQGFANFRQGCRCTFPCFFSSFGQYIINLCRIILQGSCFFPDGSDKPDHIFCQLFFHITIPDLAMIEIIFKFCHNFRCTYQSKQVKRPWI